MSRSRTADKFVVRLPEGMRNRIADIALANLRSMNSEIVARIERSLAEDEGGNHPNATPCNKQENALLAGFRQLSSKRQKAILALIGDE